MHPLGAPRPRTRELVVCVVIALVLTAALYGSYAADGGLYTDDYAFAVRANGGIDSPSDVVNSLKISYRPVAALIIALQTSIVGFEGPARFLPGFLGAALEAIFLFAVLRVLGMRRRWAAGAAALIGVLPFIDSTRLWAVNGYEGIAPCFWLAGVLAGVTGLRREGHIRRIAWHALAMLLYLAACLTYEGFVALVAVTPVLYLLAAAPRAMLRRVPFDVAIAAVALARQLSAAQDRGVDTSISRLADRGLEVAEGYANVVMFALPGDRVLNGPVGAALAALAAVGIVVALRRRGPEEEAIRAWATAVGVSLILVAGGLVMILPASSEYTPVWQGASNRFALVAAPATVVGLVAGTCLVWLGWASLVRRPSLALPGAVVSLVVTVAALAVQERANQRDWVAGAERQGQILAAIDSATGGGPAPGTSLVTLRHESFSAAGVPVFTTAWDLQGALQLRYGDPTLKAHPYELPIRCTGRTLSFPRHGDEDVWTYDFSYEKLIALDLPTGRLTPVVDRRACRRLVGRVTGALPPLE